MVWGVKEVSKTIRDAKSPRTYSWATMGNRVTKVTIRKVDIQTMFLDSAGSSPVRDKALNIEFLDGLKLAFYWGSKILLEFVKHVKKDPPKGFPNWRNGLSGLLLIKLEIGSYVDQVTGFKKALLGPRLLEANLALDTLKARKTLFSSFPLWEDLSLPGTGSIWTFGRSFLDQECQPGGTRERCGITSCAICTEIARETWLQARQFLPEKMGLSLRIARLALGSLRMTSLSWKPFPYSSI